MLLEDKKAIRSGQFQFFIGPKGKTFFIVDETSEVCFYSFNSFLLFSTASYRSEKVFSRGKNDFQLYNYTIIWQFKHLNLELSFYLEQPQKFIKFCVSNLAKQKFFLRIKKFL